MVRWHASALLASKASVTLAAVAVSLSLFLPSDGVRLFGGGLALGALLARLAALLGGSLTDSKTEREAPAPVEPLQLR
jgi:hypothetical protein